MTGQARRRGRHTLLAVAGLFAASGLVRLSDGTGMTLATQAVARAATATEEGTGALLAALAAREAQLSEAEAALAQSQTLLDQREAAIARAEAALAEGLAALEAAEADLYALMTTVTSANEADLSRLVALYEAMKPDQAAALFAEMDPAFAAGFLARMHPEMAAGVMAGLPPDRAYALSVQIAGRSAGLGLTPGLDPAARPGNR